MKETTMHSRFRLIFLLAAAAPLLAVSPRGDAAQAPQRIAEAVAGPNPVVLTWVDEADGSVKIDPDQAAAIHDIFAATVWEFFDNDQILMSHQRSGKLEPFLRLYDVFTQDRLIFIFHERTKDGTVLDGTAVRGADDPTKGLAEFIVQRMGDQGLWTSSYVLVDLRFAPPTNR